MWIFELVLPDIKFKHIYELTSPLLFNWSTLNTTNAFKNGSASSYLDPKLISGGVKPKYWTCTISLSHLLLPLWFIKLIHIHCVRKQGQRQENLIKSEITTLSFPLAKGKRKKMKKWLNVNKIRKKLLCWMLSNYF